MSQTKLQNIGIFLEEDTNINPHAVRMPYLGVDLSADRLKESYDAIRRIPISIMIGQIVKLLGQDRKTHV